MMHSRTDYFRLGTTLIELLLFVAFFAICGGIVLSLFFATSEQRVRQQTISTVEREGLRISQTLSSRIRSAERILDPLAGYSGSILTLQMADELQNPTIIALVSGGLVVGENNALLPLSSNRVTISNFRAYNTAVAADKHSALIRFTISKAIPLTLTGTYVRSFEAVVTLFPDDVIETHCGCDLPECDSGTYEWEICNVSSCEDADVTLPCDEDDD